MAVNEAEGPYTPDPYAEPLGLPHDRRRGDPRAFGREKAAQDALARELGGMCERGAPAHPDGVPNVDPHQQGMR